MPQPDESGRRRPLAPRERLVVALDVPTLAEAREIVAATRGVVGMYKIGHQLLYVGGLDLARELAGAGERVFLDVKLHDIPNTVEQGMRSIAALGVALVTVHAYPQTLAAAVRGRTTGAEAGSGAGGPGILAVTVLTSMSDADMAEAGFRDGVEATVMRRAGQAVAAGADGIVCSPREASLLRGLVPASTLLVTPGIRPAGGAAADQKRVTTPAEAIAAGADLLVVGRPILAAADRRAAAEAIVAEIAAAAPR